MVGDRPVPIKFEVDGKRKTLHIPSAIDIIIQGIEGADKNKDVTVSILPTHAAMALQL